MKYPNGRLFCLAILALCLSYTPSAAQSLLEPGCSRCDDPLLASPSRLPEGCALECYDVTNPEARLLEQQGIFTNSCPGDNCGGPLASDSSVYLFSGEFFHSAVDLRIPGRGFDFVWGRKYRSRIGPNVLIGQNWDYSYNIHLKEITQGPSQVNNLRFHSNDDMEWDAPLFPAGDPGALNYCTWRSTDGTNFPGFGAVLDPEEFDRTTNDVTVPASGTVNYYLITPKNGTRQGDMGQDTVGTPRAVNACGLVGPELVLHDGHTRDDAYSLSSPGLWHSPQFFRDLTENPGIDYRLTFPDSGQWIFHPFGGTPEDGKIASITDRNGNQMDFLYDASGRLDQVIDTLGRPIQINYNANGFIGDVTDFGGRVVSYDYYPAAHPDGSFGDLRSVTTPVVIGTPTGNDFPAGKTTTYTYSIGFADNRLNHNLLAITDPKGQQILDNIYAPTLNPLDLEYDRVVTQIWGNPAEQIDYFYMPEVPNPANNFAVVRAIENDRRGMISEYFFDDRNRSVLVRDFTGQANPNLQTTDVLNRPGLPLRPVDPPLFETRYNYHPTESLVEFVVHPNLNDEQFVYDSLNPFRRSQGNKVQECENPGPLGGNQPNICESFDYDIGVGGTTGSNFVTRHVDGRGNVTLHVYDPDGNRMQSTHRLPSIVEDFTYNPLGQLATYDLPDNGGGSRRHDKYSYYGAGPQNGYLQDKNVDALGFSLVTQYEYDIVGNLTRTIDPRGNDTTFVVNALNQVVREVSREVVPASGIRYEKDFYYDPNDNVVRIDIQNKDDNGFLDPNTHFTTVYEYDILNFMTRKCDEVGNYVGVIPGPVHQPFCGGLPPAAFVTEEFEYDANRNLTLERFGEATNGAQLDNIRANLYDERDLLFETSRAPGSPFQSTDRFTYDGNRNTTLTEDGIDAGLPHETTYVYDGYDRRTLITDDMSNTQNYTYDANGNVVRTVVEGELTDVPGNAGNVRLEETSQVYDAMDRLTDRARQFFDPATQLPIGLGVSSLTLDYSDNSQLIVAIDALANASTMVYDSANRLERSTDAKGNDRIFFYDPNDNVVTMTTQEKYDSGLPDDVFVTQYEYDGMDRRVRHFDPQGNVLDYRYDSRDNLTETQDAKRPTAADPGNVVRYDYDGLNRRIKTTRFLTTTGTGLGAPAGAITTSKAWDDSSRLIQDIDDNGFVTQYEYDPLDRRITVILPDTTLESTNYDLHDNPATVTDRNGTVVTGIFDGLDRCVSRNLALAPGVGGTTFEDYEYDGLSRMVKGQDDDSTVELRYDSLGNLVEESQNGTSVFSQYDEQGNKRELLYPSGRSIEWDYDSLNRRILTNDPGAGVFATYSYVGYDRVESRNFGNGVVSLYNYDGVVNPPGDRGVKQKVDTIHDNPGLGILIDHYVHLYDSMGNRVHRADANPGGSNLILDYVYDSIYRLRDSQRAIFGGVPGLTVYTLDGLGSRLNVAGGPAPGGYFLDPTLPVPGDLQTAQYTSTSFDVREYDENGNMTVIDNGLLTQRDFTYDYRNQLVTFQDAASGLFAEYDFDIFGRRIARRVFAGPGIDETYIYDGQLLIHEEDTPTAGLLAEYIFGQQDERIVMERAGNTLFYQEDAQHNAISLTDGGGNPVERYVYQDYGRPQFFDAFFAAQPNSAFENPYLFQGMRFDSETGLFIDRSVVIDPRAGIALNRPQFIRTTEAGGSAIFRPNTLGNARTVFGDNPASGSGIIPYDDSMEIADLCVVAMAKKGKTEKNVTDSPPRLLIKDAPSDDVGLLTSLRVGVSLVADRDGNGTDVFSGFTFDAPVVPTDSCFSLKLDGCLGSSSTNVGRSFGLPGGAPIVTLPGTNFFDVFVEIELPSLPLGPIDPSGRVDFLPLPPLTSGLDLMFQSVEMAPGSAPGPVFLGGNGK